VIRENEHGAYQEVSQEFLKEFVQKEINPNFDVYDSKDRAKRLILAKCSRLPDDEDLEKGRYGIDFHRRKPNFEEARKYSQELPQALEKREFLENIAFAAKDEKEYQKKSWIWDNFYSWIFGFSPKTIWVAPHSGDVKREPDEILPYPKLEIDAWTARITALCAMKDDQRAQKRVMISIHSNGYLGAIIDLGSFGIIEDEKLRSVAEKIERKYHQRFQIHSSDYKKDFFNRIQRWLKHVSKTRGTLSPRELKLISLADKHSIEIILKGLELYSQNPKAFTLDAFEEALTNLDEVDLKVISCNQIFPAENVGRLLNLKEKIKYGLLNSALQIECSKLYLKREPKLITEVILEIERELFFERRRQ